MRDTHSPAEALFAEALGPKGNMLVKVLRRATVGEEGTGADCVEPGEDSCDAATAVRVTAGLSASFWKMPGLWVCV